MSALSTPTPESAPFQPIDYTSWEASPEAARITGPLEKILAFDDRTRKDLFRAGLYDSDTEAEIVNAGADQALRAGHITDKSQYAPTAKPKDPNFLARQLINKGDTEKASAIFRYQSFLSRPDTDPVTLERARQEAELDPDTENELTRAAVRSGEIPFAVVPDKDGNAIFELDPELGALDREQLLDLAESVPGGFDPRFLPALEKQFTRVEGTNYTAAQFRQAGVFDGFLKEQKRTDEFLHGELEKAQDEYNRTGQLSTETQESLDRTLAALDADNEFAPATRSRLIRDTIKRASKPEGYDPENPQQHVQYLEDGTVWLPEQVIFDQAKHDQVLDSLSVTPEQKEAAKKLRAGRLESIAPAMVDAMGANPDALDFFEKSKAAGKSDAEIATEWYSKPDNYSWWGNRARSIGMSIDDAFVGLVQSGAAVLGSESAREGLQARQQDIARNREYARLSGDSYGVGMTTLNAVTPMVADLLAGLLVSAVATPVAGVAVAGARTAASSLLRSMARTAIREGGRGAVRSLVRTGTESAARTLATLGDDLVSEMARKVGGEVAERAAVRGATRAIAGQTGVAASSFTRSAGSAYVQAYSALDAQTNAQGQPLYSDEEKRKIALGTAITQGTATAAITLGFGKILGGGVEDLVTGKIGTGILKRVFGATDDQIVSATRTSALAILQAAGAEAPEEAADQLVGNVIQALGTGEEFRLGPALKEALEAGLVGGLLGAGTKSIEVGIDKYRDAKVVALEKANAPAAAAALEARNKAAATTPAAKPTVINQDGLRIQENPPLSPDPFSYGEEDPDAPNPALIPSTPPPATDALSPDPFSYGIEESVGITDTAGAVRVSAAEIESQIDAVDVQIADLKVVPTNETEGQKVRRTRRLQELNAEKTRLKAGVKNAKASGGFVLVNSTNTTAEQAAIAAEAEVAALDEEIAALSVAPAKETKAAATKREASLEKVRTARAEAVAVAQTRRAAAPIPRFAEGQSDPRALDYGAGGELAVQGNALGAPDFAPTAPRQRGTGGAELQVQDNTLAGPDFAPTPVRQRGTGGAELAVQDNTLAGTEAVPEDIIGTDQAPEPPDVEVVPEPAPQPTRGINNAASQLQDKGAKVAGMVEAILAGGASIDLVASREEATARFGLPPSTRKTNTIATAYVKTDGTTGLLLYPGALKLSPAQLAKVLAHERIHLEQYAFEATPEGEAAAIEAESVFDKDSPNFDKALDSLMRKEYPSWDQLPARNKLRESTRAAVEGLMEGETSHFKKGLFSYIGRFLKHVQAIFEGDTAMTPYVKALVATYEQNTPAAAQDVTPATKIERAKPLWKRLSAILDKIDWNRNYATSYPDLETNPGRFFSEAHPQSRLINEISPLSAEEKITYARAKIAANTAELSPPSNMRMLSDEASNIFKLYETYRRMPAEELTDDAVDDLLARKDLNTFFTDRTEVSNAAKQEALLLLDLLNKIDPGLAFSQAYLTEDAPPRAAKTPKTKKPTEKQIAAEMRAGTPLAVHETLFNDTISQGWVPTRNVLLKQLAEAGFGGQVYGKAFAETTETKIRELYPVTDVSKQKGVIFPTLDSLGFGDIKGPDNKTVKIPVFADDNTSGPFTNDPQTTAWQKNAGLSIKVPAGVAVNPAIKVNSRTGFVDYSTHNSGTRIYAKGDFKRAGNTIGSYLAFQNKQGFGASLETLPPFDSSKLAGPVDFAGMRIIPGETTEDDILRFYFAPSSDGGPSKIESAINASASGMSAVDKDQIRAAAQLSFIRELREFTLDMNDVGSVDPKGFLRTPDGYKAGIENRIANVWSKADRGKDGVINTSGHWNERGRPSHLAFFVKDAIRNHEKANERRPDANAQLGSDDVDQATALERAAARNDADNAGDMLVALDEAFTPEVLRGSAAIMGMPPETGIVDVASGVQILVSRIDSVPALRKAFEQAYLATLDLPPGPSAKRAVAIQKAKAMASDELVVLASRSALVQPGVVQAVRDAGFFKSLSYGLNTFTDAEIAQHRADNRAAVADLQLDGDLRSAIERIARSAKYPRRYRAIMLAALKMQVLPNISIVDAPAEAYAGSYTHSARLITLNLASSNGRGMLDVLAHELLHAATLEALANPQTKTARDLVAKLERARQKAAEVIPDDMAYAVSSLDEFVTHAATDPRLQVILRETFEKGKTTWQRVVDAIAKFFGIANPDFVSDLWGFINHAAEYGLRPGVAASREQRSMPGTDWARRDAEYLAAVEAGDLAAAQRMVDAAARDAGYDTRAWHAGTAEGITEFSSLSHFASDPRQAQAIRRRREAMREKAADADYDVFLDTDNYKRVEDQWNWEDRMREAVSEGFSGLIYKNYGEGFNTDEGAVFVDSFVPANPSQIKSADPVTRDDAGNVIPLSARFRPSSPDIRYTIGSVHDALKTRETGAALPRGVKTLPGMSDNPESSTVEKQFENLDEIFATIPNPIASPGSWITFMRAIGKQLGKKTPVPIAPDRAVGYSAGQGFDHIMVDLKQHPEYVEARTQGLATGTRMLEDFRSGKLGRQDLASLFLWGLFSRGIGAYPQEGAFSAIHRAGLLDKLELVFTNQMTPVELRDWALETAKGSPVGGAHRNVKAIDAMLNALTYQFDGRPAIDVLLDAWKSDMTGPQLRREVYRMFTKDRPSLQIQNKVLSFIILVSGRPDVLVLDRVQFRHLWGGEKLESIISRFQESLTKAKAATLRRASVKSDAELRGAVADVVPERTDNVYDRLPVIVTPEAEAKAIEARAEIKAFGSFWATVLEFVNPKPAGTFGFAKVSGKNKVARSGLVGLGNGLHGLAAYEAIERGLSAATEQAYRDAGIEYPGIGAFHWDSWLVSSRQAISHPTLELIAGSRDPNTSVMEGKFNTINYGMLYRYDGMYMRELLTNPGHYVMLTPEAAKDAYTTAAVNRALGRKGKNQLKLKKSEELEDDEDGPQERTRPWTEDLSPAERSAFDKWLRTLGPTVEPDPDAIADGDPDERGDAGFEDRPDEAVRAALTPEGAAPDGSRGSVDQFLPILPILPTGVTYSFDDTRPKYLAFARRSQPGVVTINKQALAAVIAGLSPANARAIVSKIVKHEIAHLAAFSTFTDADIAEMARGMSAHEINEVARRYYDSPDALARLDADLESGAITNEALVEEYLRMQLELATDGATTEATIAFHSNNPGFVARLVRYLKDALVALWRNVAGPQEDYVNRIAISRLAREYRAILRGHKPLRAEPFDPANPRRDDNYVAALAPQTNTDPDADAAIREIFTESVEDFTTPYKPGDMWRKLFVTRTGDRRFPAISDKRRSSLAANELLVYGRRKQLNAAIKAEKPDAQVLAAAAGDTSPTTTPEQDAYIAEEFAAAMAEAREIEDPAEQATAIAEAYALKQRLTTAAYVETARIKKRRIDEAFAELERTAPKTAANLKAMREGIDNISRIVKEYQPDASPLRMVLGTQEGIYLTRVYRIHHKDGDPLDIFGDPAMADVRERAQDQLMESIIKYRTAEIIEQEAEAGKTIGETEAREAALAEAAEQDLGRILLEDYLLSHGSKALPHNGSDFRTDLTRFFKKMPVPEALRHVLEEVTDPVELLTRTGLNVGMLAASTVFTRDLARAGFTSGAMVTGQQWASYRKLIQEPDNDKYLAMLVDNGWAKRKPAAGYVEVAPDVHVPAWLVKAKEDRDLTYVENFRKVSTTTKKADAGKLADLYAHPDVAAWMDHQFTKQKAVSTDDAKLVQKIGEVFAKATGTSLGIATLGSVGFYSRNLVGTVFFLAANGINPFSAKSMRASKLAVEAFLNRESGEVTKLTGIGVLNDDLRPETIKELLKGETDRPGGLNILELIGKVLGGKKGVEYGAKTTAGLAKLAELATAIDGIAKATAYYAELETMREAYPDKSAKWHEDEAAKVVKLTHQAKSQTPPFIDSLTSSSYGRLFAPFLRFKGEMFRLTGNIIALSAAEIRSDNPAIRARGYKRAAGFATIAAFSIAGPALISAMYGVGDDEEYALREALPPYLRGNSIIYRPSDDGKSIQSYDFTYLNPFSFVGDPISRMGRAVMRGEPGDGMDELAIWINSNFLSEQILAGAVGEVLRNEDSDGRPITFETDSADDKLIKLSKHLVGSSFTPQSLKALQRAYDTARRGTPGDTPFYETAAGIVVGHAMPLRPRAFETEALALKAARKQAETNRQVRALASQLKRRVNFTDGDIEDIVADLQDSTASLNQDIARMIAGYQGLGLDDAAISKQLVEAGRSREFARAIVFRGIAAGPSITPATRRDMYEAGEAAGGPGGGEKRTRAVAEAMRQYEKVQQVRGVPED